MNQSRTKESKVINEYRNHRSKSKDIDEFLTAYDNGTITERWADIEGYEGLYQVSDFGNVRHVDGRWSLLTPDILRERYFRVTLCKNGITKKHPVHRLVGQCFCENPENKKFINHMNGVPQFNYYKNLEFATCGENNSHAYRTGLHKGSAFGKFLGDAHKSVPIDKFTKDMVFVKRYACIREAGIDNGIDGRRITECARGRKKTGGGFIWRYVEKT